jgi:thiamine pyrophosphate-dependent acetolactate synthase large subunit-like protein
VPGSPRWHDRAVATGAQLIVSALERAGVEVCFGLPGVHNLPLWSALRTSPIRLVGVRHEQAAVYAADGYARATGRVGVALTTTGPGAANTLGAVGEAYGSRSPVVVIATDIPSSLRRAGVYRGVLHETTDQAAMFAPVVRRSLVAGRAEDVGPLAHAALEPAGGPVYLELPTDLLREDAGELGPAAGRPVALTGRDLGAAVALVGESSQPLVWAGSGARDAGPAVAALAQRLVAPVIETYGARGVLPPGHPCRVGMPPHVESVGRLWDEADLVVAVGSDLDGMNTQNWAQPPPPRLLAVNVDVRDATKNYEADVVVDLPADLGCRELAAALPARDGLPELVERLRAVRAEACRSLDGDALRFLDAFEHAVGDDAVVLADMCVPGYWLAGFHGFARPRRLQYPVGWGTLGYAFPAALGAALAGVGPVVSVSGDGGFLFACGELATVAQEGLGLTAVIVDDGGYGMLRYDQALAGEAPFGVDLRSPDFIALAESFGVRAEGVDDLGDTFGEALARHMEDPGPSVLVARAPALVPPPTTSPNWYRARRPASS